jgi:predicted transposase YdaD
MIEIYGDMREREGRQEGRQEGELRGKVQTIEGLVARDVPWSTIEAATGIDQATFDRLRHQLDTTDGTAAH